MASKYDIDYKTLAPSVPTRFLNRETLRSMFSFGLDMKPREEVEINTLENAILYRYYKQGWQMFNE
jgi:predicted membrane-bound spermidine synthase